MHHVRLYSPYRVLRGVTHTLLNLIFLLPSPPTHKKHQDKLTFYCTKWQNWWLFESVIVLPVKGTFYVILKRRYSFCWDLNPRFMDYTRRTLYRWTFWLWIWMGLKVAYIKYQIVCLQINQVYTIVTKWQIVNKFEQNATQK